MSQLKVRTDWMDGFVHSNPIWGPIIRTVVAENLYAVVPAKYGSKDGGVKDSDLLVYEIGVKGPPAAFRLQNTKVVCVNYPASYKPMIPSEWLGYIRQMIFDGRANNARLASILEKDNIPTSVGKVCIEHGQKEGKYCDECGAQLVGSSSLDRYLVSGAEGCPGCGYNLDHKHQQYCPGCGHQLKWSCR